MNRALMYATTAYMIYQFNMENIKILIKQGYEVDVACNMEQPGPITQDKIEVMKQELEAMGVRVFHVPVPRKITAVGAIFRSLRSSVELMNRRRYDLIHCHTPIGGVICRLANRFSRGYGRAKMIYTAHGFHFFKGAPKVNWLLYFPVEKLCSYFTDVLITINREDYDTARRKMKARSVVYVPGVGIDMQKYENQDADRAAQRAAMGVPESALLLASVGELNENKNHSTVIRAIAKLKREDVHYAIAGRGALHGELQSLSEQLGVEKQIHLLGYRADVEKIYGAADVCVFPSFREGLGLAALEGMASGLPLICSDNRGSRDYAKNDDNAYVCPADSVRDFAAAIERVLSLPDSERKAMGLSARETAGEFRLSKISAQMEQLYRNIQ